MACNGIDKTKIRDGTSTVRGIVTCDSWLALVRTCPRRCIGGDPCFISRYLRWHTPHPLTFSSTLQMPKPCLLARENLLERRPDSKTEARGVRQRRRPPRHYKKLAPYMDKTRPEDESRAPHLKRRAINQTRRFNFSGAHRRQKM